MFMRLPSVEGMTPRAKITANVNVNKCENFILSKLRNFYAILLNCTFSRDGL